MAFCGKFTRTLTFENVGLSAMAGRRVRVPCLISSIVDLSRDGSSNTKLLCMCMCMYMRMHTRMYIYVYVYMYVYISVYVISVK